MGQSDQSRSSNPMPWDEMSESEASSPLPPNTSAPFKATRSTPARGSMPWSVEDSKKLPSSFNDELLMKSNLAAKETESEPLSTVNDEPSPGKIHPSQVDGSVSLKSEASRVQQSTELRNEAGDSYRQLAQHIAMAHGVLIFLVIVLYGIWKLLECYRRPIQWAVLCSMPLRAIHGTIVDFWATSLKQGLLGTVLAVPFAICRALILTASDAELAVMRVLRRHQTKAGRKVRFTTLMEWLVSFAIMSLAFESFGIIALVVVPFVVVSVYSLGVSLGLMPEIEVLVTEMKGSLLLASGPSHRWEQARGWVGWIFLPVTKAYRLLGSQTTHALLNNLHHLVAIFLMVLLIFGSLSGLVLFSYKIGLEGKGAVIALKSHVEKSNYLEKVGLSQWIEDNNVPELIETYAGKAYETVSSQIDAVAAKYQMTELADAGKKYLIGIAQGQRRRILSNSSNLPVEASTDSPPDPSHPLVEIAHSLMQKVREKDIKGAYLEIQQSGHFLLEHFNIPKEELMDRARQAGERWLGVGKHVFANGSKFAYAVLRLFISGARMILSEAPELISFCADSFVFVTLLHYLVVSTSGGVMEQMLSMLPLSDSTRIRCAVVLDYTVSSVLLATVKAAFFQAVFTWLFFRVVKIHFLYMCTLLAFISALLPIIPTWWSSVPAGVQFIIEGKYISAVVLIAAHILLMDYGVDAIHCGIPGYNAYLTGLSLAGGMALFPSAIEGAIMGPLLMTVAISLKDLYAEFVLTNSKKRV